MLNRLADLVRLRTFADVLVRPVNRVTPELLRDLTPGAQVRARIDAVLASGAVRVSIDNQSFDIRLPFRAQTGDVIPLRVAARDPQLSFTIGYTAEQPALSTELSETARFITALLGESDKLPLTDVARGGEPLLANAPTNGAAIAAALRDALARSGLFYESHLAQWVAGERPLAALHREPQAQLPGLFTEEKKTNFIPQDAAAHGAELPRLPELPVHRDALPIIKQQLDILDARHVVWNGLIWNGQPLEWEITEEPRSAIDVPGQHRWRTRINLKLPILGEVSANLLVTTHGVAIDITAQSTDTAARLAASRSELQQSLTDAGIHPLGITVHDNEPA
jgi:hypothetical protein